MKARAVLLAVILLAARAAAQEPEVLTAEECAQSLDTLAAALDRRDLAEAATRAHALEGQRLAAGDARLTVDPALMMEVREADAAHAPLLQRRVRALAGALRAVDAARGPDPDPDLVKRLRAETEVERGGTVGDPGIQPMEVPESIVDRVGRALHALDDLLTRLLRWIWELWPDDREQPAEGGAVGVTLAAVAAAVAVLGVLAVLTVRRHRPPAAPPPPPAAGKDADEDPLSREAGEWERYARELAAAGRRREAVRAWYHAVLSALFRTGRLEPRKGRTNWEHAARLAPELRWRPSFLEITRRFEREWYGRDSSTGEALGECAQLATTILGAVRAEGGAA